MTRDARSAAHVPVGRLNGVPRMGTPPLSSVSDRDEARAAGVVTDLVERTGIRSPSSVTRYCATCGARIVKGPRSLLPWCHAERRRGAPHYARPSGRDRSVGIGPASRRGPDPSA